MHWALRDAPSCGKLKLLLPEGRGQEGEELASEELAEHFDRQEESGTEGIQRSDQGRVRRMAPHNADGDGTIRAHNTLSAETTHVQVFYPFHPLHGDTLQIVRRPKRGDGAVSVIDPTGRRLKIPVWMLLPECAEIRITERPDLSKQALLSLTSLLSTPNGPEDHGRITFCKRLLTDAKEVIVQLQLLDLMIRKENEAVPMDAKGARRSDRSHGPHSSGGVSMEGGTVDDGGPVQSQDQAEHLARKAIVYLRQSSEKQVRQNKESQRLQYDVAERMRGLGWKQVEIVDGDLGSQRGRGFCSSGRIRARPQFGGIRGGGNRRQPGSLTIVPHRQGLVPLARGVPDFWDSHC